MGWFRTAREQRTDAASAHPICVGAPLRAFVGLAVLTFSVLSTAPLVAQLASLPLGSTDSATVAAVEAEGARFPRDSIVPTPSSRYDSGTLTLVGRPSRECVPVPPDGGKAVRSGEFVIGGRLHALVHGPPIKIWWKPLDSSMDMKLLVRGRLLATPSDTMRLVATEVTASMDSKTLEPFVEEAFFPTGTAFPSAGTWVVVATTRRNWGCFLFPVR